MLERAANLIEPEGAWGQGGSEPRVKGRDGCHCADTAIFDMAGNASHTFRNACRIFFAHCIGGKSQFDTYKWNDTFGRTQAEVVAKLREAAALAREQSAHEARRVAEWYLARP